MTASSIDVFNFVNWQGLPPVIVQEQGTTFHRPGVDGIGQQTVGRWADAFTVRLTHWDSTYVLTLRNTALMASVLPRTGPVRVIYEGIDYGLTPFRTLYLVDFVNVVSCQKMARQFGGSANYTNGGQAVVEMTLTPHALY